MKRMQQNVDDNFHTKSVINYLIYPTVQCSLSNALTLPLLGGQSTAFLGKLLSPSVAAACPAAQWPKRIRSDKLNFIPKSEEKRAGPQDRKTFLSLFSLSLFSEKGNANLFASFFPLSLSCFYSPELAGEANEEVNTFEMRRSAVREDFNGRIKC